MAVPGELKVVLHKNSEVDFVCPLPVMFLESDVRETARALIRQVQVQFDGGICEPAILSFTLKNVRQ